jgi:hypothetical protein
MATSKQLYEKSLRGYWENVKTRHIYMLFEGHATDNDKSRERTFWNAGAINLRTGKSRKLRLKDFANLRRPDKQTIQILESNIDIIHFYNSYRYSSVENSKNIKHPHNQ